MLPYVILLLCGVHTQNSLNKALNNLNICNILLFLIGNQSNHKFNTYYALRFFVI